MNNTRDRVAGREPARTNWRRLFIALAIGAVPTVILFIFDLWWWGSAALLLTLLVACSAFARALYPAFLTLYSMFAIAWLSGSLLDQLLPVGGPFGPGLRSAIPFIVGPLLGFFVPVAAWFLILFVSTTWILGVSDSFDITWRQAFRFVSTRAFGLSQPYVTVENGTIAAENPQGVLSRLGGPGALVVRPGNAVVLERGGRITRIVGPGLYQLEGFEFIKQPAEAKGIVDLRGQGVGETVSNVVTKDGISLEIKVGMGYQIEPCQITDQRPSSRFPDGEARTPVIGGEEYPVYEATIRKAVFRTGAGGWKSMFPGGPISILRDIVAAYTLDQIFPPHPSEEPDPDTRTVRAIEQEILRRFRADSSGVWFKGIDIQEISVPDDVRERMLKRWTAPVERGLKLQEALAERDAIIALSEGRAQAIERVESVRLAVRDRMVAVIQKLVQTLPPMDQERVVLGFISVVQELTNRVGQDDTVAMRYIEAMQDIVQSEGPKSFVITPPAPSPGALPGPPPPSGAGGGSAREGKQGPD